VNKKSVVAFRRAVGLVASGAIEKEPI